MHSTAPSSQQVLRARNRFFFTVALLVGALVFVHVVPKSNAPHDTTRMLLTIVYFAALLGICYTLCGPRSRFFELVFAWQYEDCPDSLRRIYRDYLFALDQLISAAAFVLGAFFLSTGLDVMSLWYPGILALAPFYNLGWWFAVIAMLLFPFAAGGLIGQARQHRLLLKREVSGGYFKPRPLSELRRGDARHRREPAVEVTGTLRFRAGGRDWDWENLTQNTLIFGQPGSGKTVCVLNALLDGLLGATARDVPGSALILDPKGDFHTKIGTLCDRHGRRDDLLVLDPSDPDASIHWNPFDSPDDELELANTFAGVLEAMGMQNTQDTFWIDSAKRFIRHSIKLLRLTNPPGEPPAMTQISEMCSSFDAIADRTDLLDPADPSGHDTLRYFNEWTSLPDDTRSSVAAQITNMLDPFGLPPYDRLFSGRSTFRIADMLEHGKILYVNMPMADRPAMAKTVGTFIKLEYFRQVLRALKKRRPSFFFCDEFQNYFTPRKGLGDNAFFDKSRQSNHANVVATQNMPSLLMQSSENENLAKNLISLFAVKIFLRNSDEATNQAASGLFGQDWVGVSSAGVVGFSGLKNKGGSQASASLSQQKDAAVASERFSQLAIPSRTHGVSYCESIIHDSTAVVVDRHPRKLKWKVHPIDDQSTPPGRRVGAPTSHGSSRPGDRRSQSPPASGSGRPNRYAIGNDTEIETGR